MRFFLVVLFLVSCSYSPESPEGLIKMFIKDTSTKSVDREYYERYTTGDLLEAANSINDEVLENTKMANVKKAETKIINSKCESSKCIVTFIVDYTYQFKDEGTKSYKNEVKKIAEVEKVDGEWKIGSVTNLKTYIEAQEPIDTAPKNN